MKKNNNNKNYGEHNKWETNKQQQTNNYQMNKQTNKIHKKRQTQNTNNN